MGKPWTAQQIPDLRGRIAMVTGATSGIGWEAALELAGHGAHTVLACRGTERAQAAADRIRAARPGASVAILSLDLTSLESVRAAARQYGERHGRLDILVNNAGVMAVPQQKTADGFEMQLGTNHLGHFALTGLLMDSLSRSDRARVVTVSSLGHWRGRINFDDLQSERSYERFRAYFQSKLANVLFMRELQRRAELEKLSIISVGCHPGLSATNLGSKTVTSSLEEWMMHITNRFFAQSGASGALPTLYAATAPDVRGGEYFGPRVLGIWGTPSRARFSRRAHDTEVGRRLWEKSAELTGVKFASLARAA